VPLTTDHNYIPIIESVCDAEDVNLIIPTIDDELPIFDRVLDRFAQLGITIAASSKQTSTTCNDKYATYLFCQKNRIRTPKTRLASHAKLSEIQYQANVKPRFVWGSVNVFVINMETQHRQS